MPARRSTRSRPKDPRSRELGSTIRELREEAQQSRRELADRSGLSYSYLSEIENGTKPLSMKAAYRLASGLRIAVSELHRRTEAAAAQPVVASRTLAPSFSGEDFQVEDSGGRMRQILASQSPVMRPPSASVPAPLLRAIESGTCVAFIGAGFSAAAGLPGWGSLLRAIASAVELDDETHDHILSRIEVGGAHMLDEVAQVLQDAVGRPALVEELRRQLATPELPQEMKQRLEWLRGIPFQSILTTNFDDLLEGGVPGSAAYRSTLRPDARPWWARSYWSGHEGAPILKLHGDLRSVSADTVVLTRRDYRRRLYEDHAYRAFLRSLFATRTILYMGFSFQDAYLNELRSEMLALVGQESQSEPVSYAIASDVPPATQEHFRRNEGIEILSYDTGPDGDHAGFDSYLQAVHWHTNPLHRFARNVFAKHILWVDPHPRNNLEAFDYLEAAANMTQEVSSLRTVPNASEGIRNLEHSTAFGGFDLVITHWGEHDGTAVELLEEMRERDLRCPLIVFASDHDADERKRTALGLGAQAYCFKFETLYREIDRVLARGSETG